MRIYKVILILFLIILVVSSTGWWWWWIKQPLVGELIPLATPPNDSPAHVSTSLPPDWPISLTFPVDLRPVPVASSSGEFVWRARFADYTGMVSVMARPLSTTTAFAWNEIPDIAVRQRLTDQYQLWAHNPHQQIWLGEHEVVAWTLLDNWLVRVSLYDLSSPPVEHTRWLSEALATLRPTNMLDSNDRL